MTESRRKPRHRLRWFLIGGALGLVTAVFLATPLGQHVPERIMFTPWPLAPGLMALDNATLGTMVFGLAIVYGVNFVLYGLAFLIISVAIAFFRSFRSTST